MQVNDLVAVDNAQGYPWNGVRLHLRVDKRIDPGKIGRAGVRCSGYGKRREGHCQQHEHTTEEDITCDCSIETHVLNHCFLPLLALNIRGPTTRDYSSFAWMTDLPPLRKNDLEKLCLPSPDHIALPEDDGRHRDRHDQVERHSEQAHKRWNRD